MVAGLSLIAALSALVVPALSAALSVGATVAIVYVLLHSADWGATSQSKSSSSRADSSRPERPERPGPSTSDRPLAANVGGSSRPPPNQPLSSIPPSLGLHGYERLGKLAEGTMGELWLVRHRGLGRIAALKEIRRADVNQEDIGRFTREAQVLSSLRSPHTIHVYDFGIGQNGTPYYVMEHLDGINLQELVDKYGPMPAGRAIFVLRQICLSLQEAHEAGLVHRDIKPANIMLCHYGSSYDFVKLLDFGLVKRDSKQDADSLTRPAVVLGTPAYVAPESLRGSKYVDGRADLYAVGAVGFFLLTGRLLFDHDQPVAMAKAHLLEPAPRASERVELPAQLDDLLYDCLKKDPAERPQSAQAVVQRLDAIAVDPAWSEEQAHECWTFYLEANSVKSRD